MSNNVVVRNLLAGATYVDLPAQTTRDARIEVTFPGGTGTNVKAKQDVNNPTRLLFSTPLAVATTIVVEIDQDESFNKGFTSRVSDYDSTRPYVAGSLVFNKGRVYRACNDISVGTVFRTTNVPNATGAVWYNTAGDTGSIIESIMTLTTSDGYWPLDGTTINASWSALHSVVTPDMRMRVLAGAVAGYPANDYRSPLQTAGANSQALVASNLPPISLPLNIVADGGHTPSGSVYVSPHGSYTLQSYLQNNSNNATTYTGYCPTSYNSNPDGANDTGRDYPRGVMGYYIKATVPQQDHSASFSGSYVQPHNHNGSSVTLNTVQQTTVSVMQAQISVNRYVRL